MERVKVWGWERERREKGDLEKGKRREIVGDIERMGRDQEVFTRGERKWSVRMTTIGIERNRFKDKNT